MEQDLPMMLQWWMTIMVVGWIAWPITRRVFSNWYDQGYMFTKAVGLAILTFGVWVSGSMRVLPFRWWGIAVVGILIALIGRKLNKNKTLGKVWVYEELAFGVLLIFWALIKAHEPSLQGLEKFMDFGITSSILRSTYFPPADMWFAGEGINYYYFGHLAMAILTRLSGLPLSATFNLMLASIFAWCGTMSFGIGRQLLNKFRRPWLGALLIAWMVTLAGNLHTIYAFTNGYSGDNNPPPFWDIGWSLAGWKTYWYPNATRFIPYTIHEFPSYSFVVSDVHGHVLDIPWALLAIALLIEMFGEDEKKGWKKVGFGWLCGVMFMTNALDGPIYLGLFAFLLIAQNLQFSIYNLKSIIKSENLKRMGIEFGTVLITFALTILPFVMKFKSFVTGIGVDCPPAALVNTKIGPFLFETVDKCQKSPLWMMALLWGIFVFGALVLALNKDSKYKKLFLVVAVFCAGLLIFPEFFYFKDIYPMHFRSNTMFKLGYQVFMMMGIATGYAMWTNRRKILILAFLPLFFLVSIYPYFSVKSYFGDLKTYQGLYGLGWLKNQHPDDFAAINWMNKNISGQPVILEANGDSYTDYDRMSVFTGLPTVAGWTVHEWLWRGSYEPIAERAEEVRKVYEEGDTNFTKEELDKYKIKYIIVGDLERTKYPQLNLQKIASFGKIVFSQGSTSIYQVN